MEQSLENMKNEILLLQNMIYILIQKGQKFGAVLMELFTYLLTYLLVVSSPFSTHSGLLFKSYN